MGGSFSLEVSVQNAFGTLAGGSGVGALPAGAIGAVSSLLMAELADTLNLSGFEGGVFTTAGTTITSQLITNAYGVMTGATFAGPGNTQLPYTMFTGFDSGAIVGQLEASVGGYFGSQLAGHIVIPHYSEGAIGQQIGPRAERRRRGKQANNLQRGAARNGRPRPRNCGPRVAQAARSVPGTALRSGGIARAEPVDNRNRKLAGCALHVYGAIAPRYRCNR